jgi:DNA (cytosine-5)-methyltransferase 1
LDSLENVGYNNYFKVLNAKDFGIPQNRERVFIVSIRKDVDTGAFEFPEGYPLKLRLKDLLETEVDEKFYLSEKMKDYLFSITEKNKARGNGNVYVPTDVNGISKTITTKEGSRVKDNFIEEITDKVMRIGNCRPTKNRANPNQGRICDVDGISPCLKIRKLTPKECFRLMGFKDEEFAKAQCVCVATHSCINKREIQLLLMLRKNCCVCYLMKMGSCLYDFL